MKLTFLGGADEVGASCTLLEVAGKRILVDCGLRMNSRDGDNLPWLAPIQEGGGLDAIILTHAHMDHLGAMPLIHQSYPNVPIYMTAPTLALSRVLLLDSLKIMQGNHEKEGEIPLYPAASVEGLLLQARPVQLKQELRLFGGAVSLFFFPAGHILGAACVYLVSKEGSILMGGDISVTSQLTIPGLELPKIRPDVVVMESTYGGRLHANRKAEENRIIKQVEQVLEQNGAILFPAFAIGRAQEVILILSRAMEQKKLPKAPIFVDGMVKQVCEVYRSFPEYLTPWMKKRVERRRDPFFYEGGPAIPVYSPQDREKAAKMRPAIFISSSGMLTGGPSPYYASILAEYRNCWIGITGYQDEEAPGRRVQEAFAKGGGEIDLYGKRVELKCGVGTYGLSAHADTSQIVASLHVLAPREIFLVHGDEKAREALQSALVQTGTKNVHLPFIGEEIELKGTQTGFLWKERRQKHPAYKEAAERIERGQEAEFSEGPLEAAQLQQLSENLLQRDGAGRLYTVTELMEAWGYPPAAMTSDEVERVTELIAERSSPFRADRDRKTLFRVRVYHHQRKSLSQRTQETFEHVEEVTAPPPEPWHQSRVLQLIDELFPPQTTLYKRSIIEGENRTVLSFHFPLTAQRIYQNKLQELREATLWQVDLRPHPHQQALQDKALELLSEEWSPTGSVQVHLDKLQVVVPILVASAQQQRFEQIQKEFMEQTGFSMEAKQYESPVQKAPHAQVVKKEAMRSGRPPMEINAAYQTIRHAFVSKPHAPYKVGLKAGCIELSFLTPQVGALYQDFLVVLGEEIGWELTIREHANQHEVKGLARRLLPSPWGKMISKEPQFLVDTNTVQVVLMELPPPDIQEDVKSSFSKQTCLSLELIKR